MSFGAELVARTLGLSDVPFRAVRRTAGWFLLITAIAMPITFRHGLELFANREAQQIVHRVVDPVVGSIQQQTPAPPTAVPPVSDSANRP